MKLELERIEEELGSQASAMREQYAHQPQQQQQHQLAAVDRNDSTDDEYSDAITTVCTFLNITMSLMKKKTKIHFC